ncbi:hypothetical protein B5F39_09955 [Cloacibacillus sp. An23]|nr:hypothetical protein B5F39_09955 [Cloacibacillus sp. An23]
MQANNRILRENSLSYTLPSSSGKNTRRAAAKTPDGVKKSKEETDMKARKFLAIAVMCAAMAAAACGVSAAAEKADGYTKINAQEAKEMIEGSAPVVLLDTRKVEEYNEGHIPGAIVISHESVKTELPKILPDKNATLVIYCRSGKRATAATQDLVAEGYKNIYLYTGGMLDWPYEVAK